MIASAVLELFAVLFGVLLALWVNDWNEGRKERRREVGYLKSLLDDVSADCRALEDLIAYADGTGAAARTILGLVRGRGDDATGTSTLLRLLKRAGTLYPFRATTTTFQELSGSGGLTVISDRSLRRRIIEYYTAVEFPREVSALAIRRTWYDYYDALADAIDPAVIPRITKDILTLMDEGGPFVTRSEIESAGELPSLGLRTQDVDVNDLRNQPDLQRALALVLDVSSVMSWSLQRLKESASRLRTDLSHTIERGA